MRLRCRIVFDDSTLLFEYMRGANPAPMRTEAKPKDSGFTRRPNAMCGIVNFISTPPVPSVSPQVLRFFRRVESSLIETLLSEAHGATEFSSCNIYTIDFISSKHFIFAEETFFYICPAAKDSIDTPQAHLPSKGRAILIPSCISKPLAPRICPSISSHDVSRGLEAEEELIEC